MPRTFANYPCTFTTHNTENNYGDSSYTVTDAGMVRNAPVNAVRAPNQVQTGNPAVCYLDPNGETYRRIMAESDDSNVTITNVQGDDITVQVGTFIGVAVRIPQLQFRPFDFVNNDGTLTHIHMGHAINTLS